MWSPHLPQRSCQRTVVCLGREHLLPLLQRILLVHYRHLYRRINLTLRLFFLSGASIHDGTTAWPEELTFTQDYTMPYDDMPKTETLCPVLTAAV